MAKSTRGVRSLVPQLERAAEDMGLEFVDIELAKEHGSMFLRMFIDKEGGPGLSDCEKFHRAILPMMEDEEYDYLEVSTPGLDRPLKRQKDFDRYVGKRVEARLFKSLPGGVKSMEGELAGLCGQTLRLTVGGEVNEYDMKDIAQVRLVADVNKELLEGKEH